MAPKRKSPAAVVVDDGGDGVLRCKPKVTAPMVTLGQIYLFCERVESYGRREATDDHHSYCAAHGCFNPVTYFTESELQSDARNRRCRIRTSSDVNLLWPMVIDRGDEIGLIDGCVGYYGKVELLERADMKI
eukprot:7381916-Prymnesium_polylepis.1